MDIDFINQKIESYLSQGIDKFHIDNGETIVLMISGLRALREFNSAIALYQKYDALLRNPDIYPVALTNILQVCNDCGNTKLLIRYAKELKAIEPNHPFVIKISKDHPL